MKKVIVLNIVFLIFITIHFSVDQSNGFIKIFFENLYSIHLAEYGPGMQQG